MPLVPGVMLSYRNVDPPFRGRSEQFLFKKATWIIIKANYKLMLLIIMIFYLRWLPTVISTGDW